jgi:serine/threonine protein kinase
MLGRLVGQKFRIERLIGAGAMGRVYLAEQTNLGKQVALKVLHANMAGDSTLAKRFYREAKSASMLSHPNILQIIDFGDDEGTLFIAMELLTGRDLYRAIKEQFPFSLERIGHIGGQILGALDEAHVKGVVHRDLKPENVMLLDVRGESDFVKVCDFGIAKIASERDGEGSAITMAGMVCGTPEYMSPEQARGDSLDGRSDLYAAAVILYQMVAGDVPFRAESALGVITKHLTEEPRPPSQRRSNVTVPPALEAVIMRGLRKVKDERFASAFEMKSALLESLGMKRPSSTLQARGGQRITDVGMAATGVATPVSTPQMEASDAKTTPSFSGPGSVHGEMAAAPSTGRRAGTIVISAVLVSAIAAGAYVMIGKKGAEPAVNLVPPPKIELPRAAPPPEPHMAAAAPVALPPVALPPVPPPPAVTAVTTVTAVTPPKKGRHERGHTSAAAGVSAAVKSAGMAGAESPAPPEPSAPPKPSTAPKGAFAEGEALFKSGDIEGALAKYQDVARANPNDAKAQRQIGKCYNRLGQRDKAMPYFKRYLELAPDASDAQFIRATLDSK